MLQKKKEAGSEIQKTGHFYFGLTHNYTGLDIPKITRVTDPTCALLSTSSNLRCGGREHKPTHRTTSGHLLRTDREVPVIS